MPDQRQGGISWTHETWNVIRGCSRVSEGCRNCYAERIAATRLAGPGQAYHDLAVMTTAGPRWTGKVVLVPQLLDQPFRWKRPRLIFVNAMSDLYHENLLDHTIDLVWEAMKAAPWHTYQLLTKRADRLLEWSRQRPDLLEACRDFVWIGVSAEDQPTWDDRVGKLIQLRSVFHGVLWVSAEPLLGPIDPTPPSQRGTNVNLDDWLQAIDWLVVGGESGPDARPMNPVWARKLRDRAVGRTDMGRPWSLPFHFKQYGEYMPDGIQTLPPVTEPDFFDGGHAGQPRWVLPGGQIMRKVGKQRAGHLLDGQEWLEFPRTVHR